MSSEDEVVARERVVFKYEDDDGDEMIGPVWVDILGGEGEIVSSEDFNWMTLTKARELAQEVKTTPLAGRSMRPATRPATTRPPGAL